MAFHLGFGPLTIQRGPGDDRSWPQRYDDALRAAVEAEAAGFDSVWVGEHHLSPDGYLPAVFPFLAALAVRTSRVELGTKVVLAPLHHPLRIAEDAAAVSILSSGRLILGLALGYRPEEFAAFGADRSTRAAALEETVAVCRTAWSGEPFSHTGPRMSLSAEVIEPAPPPIPIWLGGRAAAALERTGRIADGFVAPVGPADDLARQLAVVDSVASRAGRPLPGAASSAMVLLGSASGAPPPSALAGVDALLGAYAAWKGDDPTSRIARPEARSRMLVEGGAAEVAAALLELVRAGGTDRDHHVVARLEYPGMTGDEVVDHLRRFARDVAPRLRDAGL